MEGARSIWTVLPALKRQPGSVTEIKSSKGIFQYSADLTASLRLSDLGRRGSHHEIFLGTAQPECGRGAF